MVIGFGFDLGIHVDLSGVGKDLASAGQFVGNAVSSAGRELGHLDHTIQNAAGQISQEVGKIPVVGGPMRAIFDVAYQATMGPIDLAVAVAVDGKQIDKAVMDQLSKDVQAIKEIAPYAQMVISLVPGIGPGVSGAISAGLALASGQPIDQALEAGIIGAIPGGPLVKAAATLGIDGTKAAIEHKNMDPATLANTVAGASLEALGLPTPAKNALLAGVNAVGQLAHGDKPDMVLLNNSIAALPIDSGTKAAMTEGTGIITDLANGKPLDPDMVVRIGNAVSKIPMDPDTKDQINGYLNSATKDAGKVLSSLQSGMVDNILKNTTSGFSPDAQKALQIGMSTGSAVVQQAKRADQLLNKVPGKLVQSGIQLAQSQPVIAEARKLAGQGTNGFDTASGLLGQRAKLFDFMVARSPLSPTDKVGFDMASSLRIGLVSNPKNTAVTDTAAAAQAITLGMQGHTPDAKQAMMTQLVVNQSAIIGATVAVNQVQERRTNWLVQLLQWLGLLHS